MSLYQDSWQNATVDHNIFYNCQRAMSFHLLAARAITQVGSLAFTNNLIYMDQLRDDPVTSGQAGFAWNGGPGKGYRP